MTHAIDLKYQPSSKLKQLPKFIFIGNASTTSVDLTKERHLPSNRNLLSQIDVGNFSLIDQIHVPRNLSRQLKNLRLKPGKIVQLVSKTSNGSVVISINNKLIGIGAEIAQKIIVTLVDDTKL
ncbi:MAG TPA: ferrous iron transport protein A [Coleofasciculaceae cyanobacterium]|jgi:Fe2+ transport system protein FeoA